MSLWLLDLLPSRLVVLVLVLVLVLLLFWGKGRRRRGGSRRGGASSKEVQYGRRGKKRNIERQCG